jgi:hypothetical protein
VLARRVRSNASNSYRISHIEHDKQKTAYFEQRRHILSVVLVLVLRESNHRLSVLIVSGVGNLFIFFQSFFSLRDEQVIAEEKDIYLFDRLLHSFHFQLLVSFIRLLLILSRTHVLSAGLNVNHEG